jgi:hypothetical protein
MAWVLRLRRLEPDPVVLDTDGELVGPAHQQDEDA